MLLFKSSRMSGFGYSNPLWMSVDQPSESASGSDSPKLKKAEAIHLQKLEKDAADLHLSSLPSDIAETFRVWPVNLATCKLHHRWVDLAPAFWPRWLRQTDCERPEKERSCSFPKGMKCVRAQTVQIKILAWNCLEIREGSKNLKGEKCEHTEIETSGEVKRCLWRQVSHPVVTSCIGLCK
uniref:Noggin n=1 Tax=Xiphophorus maculatus TaxID=8083 RepID=A0A3B5QN01_XIPMA